MAGNGPSRVQHVRMGERYALWKPGGAGRVHQHCRLPANDRRQRAGCTARQLQSVDRDLDNAGLRARAQARGLQSWHMLGRCKYDAGRGMRHDMLELAVLRQQIEGRHHVPTGHRPQECHQRGEAVGQHEADHIAGRDAMLLHGRDEVANTVLQRIPRQRNIGLRRQRESCIGRPRGMRRDCVAKRGERCLDLRGAGHAPCRRRYSPKSISSVGSCTSSGAIGCTTRVMFRKCR